MRSGHRGRLRRLTAPVSPHPQSLPDDAASEHRGRRSPAGSEVALPGQDQTNGRCRRISCNRTPEWKGSRFAGWSRQREAVDFDAYTPRITHGCDRQIHRNRAHGGIDYHLPVHSRLWSHRSIDLWPRPLTGSCIEPARMRMPSATGLELTQGCRSAWNDVARGVQSDERATRDAAVRRTRPQAAVKDRGSAAADACGDAAVARRPVHRESVVACAGLATSSTHRAWRHRRRARAC